MALDDNLEITESQQVQVGSVDRWSVHIAELINIFYAVSIVFKIAHQQVRSIDGQQTATILYNSRSALQAVQSARNKIRTTNRSRDPPGGRQGSSSGNRATPSVGAKALQQPKKRCRRPTSQKRSQSKQNPSFPPAPHQREGTHTTEHLYPVGTRIEIIHQG